MAKRFPSDVSSPDRIEQIVRVNHAGEYGAKRIYAGQYAVLKNKSCGPTIKHMAEQEQKHLDEFDSLLASRKFRPTAMLPLWHVAGYALGAGTALLGEKAAMACTVAVEEVIDEHYRGQLEELKDDSQEKYLADKISRFRAEELEHRDIGLQHEAERAPAYNLLTGAIKKISRTAIWLSTRI